jgi:hypothetical protein
VLLRSSQDVVVLQSPSWFKAGGNQSGDAEGPYLVLDEACQQGAAENNEATDYPIPGKTSTDRSAQADDCAERTEERKAVPIQRAPTDLFNAPASAVHRRTCRVRKVRRYSIHHKRRGWSSRAARGLANVEAPASNKPVSPAKRARTSCFLTAARPRWTTTTAG